MTQLANDTFQRANQSGWGTASDGQVWSVTGPGTLAITGNEGTVISNFSDTHVQLGTKVSNDIEILCRMAISDSNDICGLQGRFTTSGGISCYKFLYYTGGVHINKSITGSSSNLANASFTMSTGVFYWFRFRITGSLLLGKIWQDGTAEPSAFTVTSTDISVNGAGGIAVLANTATASNVISFDHFYAVDYILSDSNTEVSSYTTSFTVIKTDTFSFTEIWAIAVITGETGTFSEVEAYSLATGNSFIDSLTILDVFIPDTLSVKDYATDNLITRSGFIKVIIR